MGSRTRGLLGFGLVVGLAALASWSPPARAQGHPAPRPGAGPGGDEEMRAALEQVMLVRLKRTLELTPEQEGRVMPRIENLLASRREFAPRRREAVAHLKAVMGDPAASDAEIQKALKAVHETDDAFRQREQELKRDVDRELSPRQQARLYFFEEHFRRAMQRRMLEAKQRDGPGRTQPAGPVEIPDDDSDGGGQ